MNETFWNKVKINDGCWTWLGAKNPKGYGRFSVNGKLKLPHRVSYEIFYSEIPETVKVCHKCDNPSCVNPRHLFLGTQSENMLDCSKKGRLKYPKGKVFKKGHTLGHVIPKEKVVFIKEEILKRKNSLKDIVIFIGVPYQSVRDISRGKTYKNILLPI